MSTHCLLQLEMQYHFLCTTTQVSVLDKSLIAFQNTYNTITVYYCTLNLSHCTSSPHYTHTCCYVSTANYSSISFLDGGITEDAFLKIYSAESDLIYPKLKIGTQLSLEPLQEELRNKK